MLSSSLPVYSSESLRMGIRWLSERAAAARWTISRILLTLTSVRCSCSALCSRVGEGEGALARTKPTCASGCMNVGASCGEGRVHDGRGQSEDAEAG